MSFWRGRPKRPKTRIDSGQAGMTSKYFMNKNNINSIITNLKAHFTFSQKRLLNQYISEICVREGISAQKLFQDNRLNQIIKTKIDPVQKGNWIFDYFRKRRYPLSEGKIEVFINHRNNSKTTKFLNSKIKLVNPYFYGDGVFDLKEHVISLVRSCPLDCAYCFVKEVYDRASARKWLKLGVVTEFQRRNGVSKVANRKNTIRKNHDDQKFKIPPNFEKIENEIKKLIFESSHTSPLICKGGTGR